MVNKTEMTTLDHLRQRVLGGTMNLRNEMIAAGTDDELLPVDKITVKKTSDGVTVRFIEKPVTRKDKLSVPKADDES